MQGGLIEKGPAAAERRPQVRWQSAALLTAAVAGAGLALARADHGARATSHPAAPAAVVTPHLPEVQTMVVSTSPLQQAIRVTGTLKSNEVVKVSTKSVGLVRRVAVEEGDRVRPGQLLVQLDDTELQAQRARALASVRAAEANVRSAQANLRSAQAKLSQSGTSKTVKDAGAQSQFRQAEQEVAAARSRLSQAKAKAGIQATQAETRVAAARSALQSAKEQLQVLQEGARRQETAQAQAQVAQAQAQVDKLKSQYVRRRNLLAQGYIAAEDAENAQRDYQAAIANLNAAKQQLDLVKEGPRSGEIRMQEEAVRQAEANLRDAEANKAQRAISDDDVQTAEAQVRQAQAAFEAARAGLGQREISDEEIRAAQAAVGQAQAAVGQARAAVSQAQAEVRNVEAQLAQTRIYSPVSGVVSERKVHVGESISAGNSDLMTLVASDALYLEATAPETALPYLRTGAPTAVTLDAAPGRTFPGRLREVIRVTEGSTRSVRLRISVAGARAGVVGGFARATLQGGTDTPVLSVPRSAVLSDQGQTNIYVYRDGRVQARPVEVGAQTGQRVEILKGLRVGEEIVTEEPARLTDGLQVTQKRSATAEVKE